MDYWAKYFSTLFLLLNSGAHSMPLVGHDHYYTILSIGDNEKFGNQPEAQRFIKYLTADYNPYSIQELKTSISVSCYAEARHIDGEVFTATCPPGCDGISNRLWGSGVYTEDSSICGAAIHDGVIADAVKARRPTYEVSCIVQADWIRETDFNVICPAGCEVVAEKLWGDTTYMEGSYICAAAIHSGIIADSIGGEVHVIKTGFVDSFEGSTRNGVVSSKFSVGRESFELEMSCYFRADHVVEEVFTARCPPGCDDVSDQVYGTGIYTQDSFLCASAIHAGRINAPVGGIITVYKTSGKISFVGSLQNEVSSKNSESGVESFIFQDSSVREPEIVTAACELRGDHLRDDVATVKCPQNCDHKQYEVWGTDTYKSNSHICASAAHAGIIDVSLGGPVTVKRVSGLQKYDSTTNQRIVSKAYGASDTAFIFAVNCEFNADLINDTMFSLMCPTGCSNTAQKVWGDGIYTSDSPLCTAALHDGYLKDSIGGKITVHKVEGRANYGEALRNGIQSFNYGSWSRSSILFQRPSIEVETVFPVTCETRANFMVDDTFTVICPAGCDAEESNIWGTGVYTDDSYVCGAAIHDGRLPADIGGQVTIGKVPGLESYSGSTQNNIESKTKGKWRKSIIFRDAIQQHTSTYTVSCDVEGGMILDSRYTVICPPGCQDETERVWGSDVYTEDSFICAAALHAGKVSEHTGGQVTVTSGDAELFKNVTRNGITSKLYDKPAAAFQFI